MEIKINREIMRYSESVFMGLSLRQFVCSALAVISAVAIYFSLSKTLGADITSYICIASAVPFAVLGFFNYHSMSAEKFLITFIRSELLEKKIFLSSPRNIYMDILT